MPHFVRTVVRGCAASVTANGKNLRIKLEPPDAVLVTAARSRAERRSASPPNTKWLGELEGTGLGTAGQIAGPRKGMINRATPRYPMRRVAVRMQKLRVAPGSLVSPLPRPRRCTLFDGRGAAPRKLRQQPCRRRGQPRVQSVQRQLAGPNPLVSIFGPFSPPSMGDHTECLPVQQALSLGSATAAPFAPGKTSAAGATCGELHGAGPHLTAASSERVLVPVRRNSTAM
jgi:hypothetical protein